MPLKIFAFHVSANPVPSALWLGISTNAKIRFSTNAQRYHGPHPRTIMLLGWASEFLVYISFPHGLRLGICELLWRNSSYLIKII